MTQEVTIAGNQVQVALQGSIYAEEAAALRKTLIGYIDRGHTSFLVDLSEVDYIDSAGVGTMVDMHNRSRKRGSGVVIKGLNGLVKDMFILTRVGKILSVE